jgi:cell division transport system permease protein
VIIPKLRRAGADALRNIWLSKTRHLVSFAVTVLAFLTVGLFLALANNLRLQAERLSKDAALVFYLKAELAPAEQDLILQQVLSAPLIAGATLVSAEEAREKFLGQFPSLGDIVQSLGHNPFPASVEATLRDPAVAAESVQSFIAEVRLNPGVEDAVFNREGADRIRGLGRLAEAVAVGFGGFLVLASVVIISGVIKLNVLARRDEVEILRLVGATNTYIRGPYLLEGLILGISGSAAAVVLVALAARLYPAVLGGTLGPLGELIGFEALSAFQALGLVIAGGLAGLLGSASSLARFLRI